jgi:hypothetical protein
MRRLARAVALPGRLLYWAVTLQLVNGIRRLKYARLIRRSLLLDPDFYLGQCGQDLSARRDPYTHYLTTGAGAGLDPNPYFDTRFYLERNPEVAEAGKNPLVHYIRHGSREGRAPSALFDGAYYVERYPDVVDSGWPSPLAHYLEQGRSEGRVPVRSDEGLLPDLLEWMRERDPARADRVLVVDHAMLTPDRDSASVRMLAIVRMLREVGLIVTFGAAGRTEGFEDGKRRLAALGVESLCGPDAITSHLIAFGHLYGSALLSRPDVARRYMPLVRGHAPWAKVVYDAVDLEWVRLLRGAELTGDDAAREAARRSRNIELLNTAAADLTLAVTADEREVLSRAVPEALIEVVPNVHECSPSTRDVLRERVRKLLEPEGAARLARAAGSAT